MNWSIKKINQENLKNQIKVARETHAKRIAVEKEESERVSGKVETSVIPVEKSAKSTNINKDDPIVKLSQRQSTTKSRKRIESISGILTIDVNMYYIFPGDFPERTNSNDSSHSSRLE